MIFRSVAEDDAQEDLAADIVRGLLCQLARYQYMLPQLLLSLTSRFDSIIAGENDDSMEIARRKKEKAGSRQ